MDKKVEFRVSGLKKNGDKRDKTFDKINEAIRYLWRIKEAKEVYLEVFDYTSGRLRRFALFVKMGRRRGINSEHARLSPGKLSMDKIGAKWMRLPSKFNDLD